MENEQYPSEQKIQTNYTLGNVKPNFKEEYLQISGTTDQVAAYMNALESQGINLDEDEVRRILGN
ncbi:hypothetical protein M0R72_04155 [Candidatus Pacearchaeota archaeon]|jgi:N-dimethylarginine dimethylaminohydrolase|nr:hypothetical protein [Candidatus Pacearchaeota archaeon]